MSNYGAHVNTRVTSQSKAIPGKDQVKNYAGGFTFAVDNWTRLHRFIVLGTEGGSYYASEKTLTVKSADAVFACLKEDGLRVVQTVVDISTAGRAHKNDAALFVLAVAAGQGDDVTRAAALNALPQVARTGTHLFMFLDYVQGFRGWGRSLRRAVANWYLTKDADNLAYQMAKYRQRGGWSQRDVLRKSHPQPLNQPAHAALFAWATGKDVNDSLPSLIPQFEALQNATDANEVISLVSGNSALSHEMIPTQFLGDPKVWEALLPTMPMGALIRNLGRMSANGLLVHGSDAAKTVVTKLSNGDVITKARVHPISVLAALMTYRAGHGIKGNLTWTPVTSVIDALDGAFYASFGNVESTGKRRMFALDVSGSMAGAYHNVGGVPGLSARAASAALALVGAATEADPLFVGFTGGKTPLTWQTWGNPGPSDPTHVSALNISKRQRLDDVVNTVSNLPMGRTDCALPMLYAQANGLDIDSFEIYTDNETWVGSIHPSQALVQYREKTGIPAKLSVVAMTATEFSIADPNDAGMLDVVGFDTATPNVVSQFITG